ncbi:hypothetical protein QYM36_003928, partial [Artemia franciscana]
MLDNICKGANAVDLSVNIDKSLERLRFKALVIASRESKVSFLGSLEEFKLETLCDYR